MTEHELLLACRGWMQSALEELTMCATAHTASISLTEGERLLDAMDVVLRGSVRLVTSEDALRRRLAEVEGAMVALSGALTSLDALVKAANAIERSTS